MLLATEKATMISREKIHLAIIIAENYDSCSDAGPHGGFVFSKLVRLLTGMAKVELSNFIFQNNNTTYSDYALVESSN